MTLAVVMSRALDGLLAPQVHVEVQLANGLPSFMLVGLADIEVKEARERCCSGIEPVERSPGSVWKPEPSQNLSDLRTSTPAPWAAGKRSRRAL